MPSGARPMFKLMRVVFWFVAANALGGALALMLFPGATDRLFFWTITPPINAALFGALYLGGAAVVGWVTYRGSWEEARFLVPILVAAGVLISLITLLHLDRFAPGLKLFYWLVIYIGAPLLAIVFYVQHERAGAIWAVREPVRPATRRIAALLGALLLLVGLALVIWPQAVAAGWPWPMTPLMLRIFAAWFSAFGVGLLWFLVDREWSRVRHVATLMIAASALDLLMIALHRGDITAQGALVWLYCAHLALFGGIGLLMHWLQRNPLAARLPAPT